MSETPHRTPAQRRAARVVTATVVASGLALAGGSAYAQARDSSTDRPAPVAAAPAPEPVAETRRRPAAGRRRRPADLLRRRYTYDDAVVLGAQWNLDPFEAKAEAGRKLAAGQTLPVAPGSSPVAEPAPVADDGSAAAVDAFFAAGHDYDDAVALAAVWNVDPFEAKVTAGSDPGRGNPAGGTLNALPRTGFEVELLAPRGRAGSTSPSSWRGAPAGGWSGGSTWTPSPRRRRASARSGT